MAVIGSEIMKVWFILAAYASLTAGLPSADKTHTYHGKISEAAVEEDEVLLDRPLAVKNWNKLTGDEICGYTLYQRDHHPHPSLETDGPRAAPQPPHVTPHPFRVDVLDRKTGRARIVVETGRTLDYESKRSYSLEVAAYDCVTGLHADRERLRVSVEDVNEFSPVWEQDSYSGWVLEEAAGGAGAEEVSEGEGGVIVRVKAVDADGSGHFSRVCLYHVVSPPEAPFSVDETGALRSTQALSSDTQTEYSLEVKAEDCGGRMSDKVARVSVRVKPRCKPHWTGINDHVDIAGPMVKQVLMSGASLDLCNLSCNPVRVTVDIKLETSHIARGCDRDVYSLQAHRKICGAAPGGLDLLPRPGAAASWTRGLPTNENEAEASSVDTVFQFDGKTTAVLVPRDAVDPGFGGGRFTLSTWMKHEKNAEDANPHGTKEHIVCSSDGEGMNRHHVALYVHNCRLVLLLRREPPTGGRGAGAAGGAGELSPAEWRWSLGEACDGRWHHYALTVDLPKVRLFVDGREFVESASNPEVLDDWALHQIDAVHSLKLTVGACWQGGKKRMSQYLKGELSGLTLLTNHTDSAQVIQCLTSCQERLDLDPVDDMDTGMSVSMSSEMDSMTVVGLSVGSVERLLHNVGYINTRMTPTPGTRTFALTTKAECADPARAPVIVQALAQTLMVYEASRVVLTLGATTQLIGDVEALARGKQILGDLVVSAATRQDDMEGYLEDADDDLKPMSAAELGSRYLIDSCSVEVEPRVQGGSERFSLPLEAVGALGLELTMTERGFILTGADKVSTYQQVLRQVVYINSRGADLNRRLFTLTCTEVNQHLVSNPLVINLEVIHAAPEKVPHVAKAAANAAAAAAAATVVPHAAAAAAAPHAAAAMQVHKESHHVMMDSQRLLSNSLPGGFKYDSQETGIGVAVVMIVCVGFIVMLIVLGIVRVRNAQRGGGGEGEEGGQWEGGAGLNITVNPMDPDSVYEEEEENGVPCHDDASDSDDDDVMYRDERLGGSEGGARGGRGSHKWDKMAL